MGSNEEEEEALRTLIAAIDSSEDLAQFREFAAQAQYILVCSA